MRELARRLPGNLLSPARCQCQPELGTDKARMSKEGVISPSCVASPQPQVPTVRVNFAAEECHMSGVEDDNNEKHEEQAKKKGSFRT